MFKTFLKTYEISFAQNVNMWIYYIRKLPFIGNKIPESLYGSTKSKVVLSNIIRILLFLFGFIRKFMYMLLIIVLPAMLISEKTSIDISNLKFHIFFFLSFLTGALINNKFADGFSKDFYMINLMRINAKEYYLSNILFSYVEYFIYFLFPMMLLGCSFSESIIITLEFVAFRVITQGFHLLFVNYKNFQLSIRWYFVLPVMLIPLLIAYGSHFIGFTFNAKTLLLNIPFIIIVLTLASLSLFYLLTYKKYNILARNIVSKSDIDKISAVSSDAMFMDVKLDEKKLDNKNLENDKYKDKTGLSYLNAKFMERHRKIIINPIKIRVFIIIVLLLATTLITIIFPQLHEKINNTILTSSGILVFVLYCLSIGEKTTKAFFFNCDNSLLRYRFYREPKTILSNFTSRLKIVTLLNLIPAIFIAVGLYVILILSKGDLLRFIPVFISIVALSCFFSVHYLFLYYIAQPYTSQLTIKSPIYRFASILICFFAYGCLQVKTASLLFTLSIIILTITYTVVSLILVYKFAPNNFRLK